MPNSKNAAKIIDTGQLDSQHSKLIDEIIAGEEERGRNITPENRLFLLKLAKEIKNFELYAPKDQALVFQPLAGYQRFLVHRLVENAFKELTSFSIGEDGERRTVICFKENKLHKELKPEPEQKTEKIGSSVMSSKTSLSANAAPFVPKQSSLNSSIPNTMNGSILSSASSKHSNASSLTKNNKLSMKSSMKKRPEVKPRTTVVKHSSQCQTSPAVTEEEDSVAFNIRQKAKKS